MKIENNEELLAEIEKVLTSVHSKTRGNPDASVYLDLYTKLILIQGKVKTEDFSIESKKTCNMSGPLVHLSEGQTRLTTLGTSLCAINNYYQGANIKTLDKDDASMFFVLK